MKTPALMILVVLATCFSGCAETGEPYGTGAVRNGLLDDGRDGGKADDIELTPCTQPGDCAEDEYCDQICLMYCSVEDPGCCQEGVCVPAK